MSVRSLYTTASLLSVDDGNYFVINAQDRTITPPANFKNFGVESDENSNRVWFKCPRIVGDNLDLTTLNLRVNYQNANGDKDKYVVTDVTADGENVVFSWRLSRKCTLYKGVLSFIVCAVKTDSSGVIVNEWNTTLCSGDVLEGLEVENPESLAEVSDLVSQLVDLVNGSIADMQTAAAESVANVKAAEAQAVEAVSNAPNSLFANAIKGKASGEVIRVDDVSPVEHTVGVKVNSKNFIDFDRVTLIRCVLNGDTVVSNISESYYCKITVNHLGDYLLANKGKALTFSVADAHGRKLSIVLFGTFENSTDTFRDGLSVSGENFVSFVIPSDLKSVVRLELRFNYEGASSFTDTETVFEKLQLEESENATEYKPYVDPSTVTLSRCGKNLFNIGNFVGQSKTNNGITVDILDSGEIYIHGVAENTSIETSMTFTTKIGAGNSLKLPAGVYMDNFTENTTGNKLRCFAQATSKTGAWVKNFNGYATEVLEPFYLDQFVVYMPSGVTGVISQHWRLQIESGEVTTGYAEYVDYATHNPAADGAVNVSSVAPTMTLLTDTEGVTVECEYTRDTNKVIEELFERLSALEGGS